MSLSYHLAKMIDELFLFHIMAIMCMTTDEIELSEERSRKYGIAWRAYLSYMRNKNGLDGGPSPAIICDTEFKPELWGGH